MRRSGLIILNPGSQVEFPAVPGQRYSGLPKIEQYRDGAYDIGADGMAVSDRGVMDAEFIVASAGIDPTSLH